MIIKFHGAAKEVGKSCIELITEKKQRYLLDAGIKFIKGGIEYPKLLDKVNNLNGVFISHAHLDHSGALPLLEHKKLQCPIYMTSLSWQITNKLLADSYHLEMLRNSHPAYEEIDIDRIHKNLKLVKKNKTYLSKRKDIQFAFVNSGHIPGSASIILNVENKKILYTADLNTRDSSLLFRSEIEKLVGIDILICEATYGDRYHQNLKETENLFLEQIEKAIRNGGSVLLPVFGVGRAQELLILLSRLNNHIPIYIDGMAKSITELTIEYHDEDVKNVSILKNMYDYTKKIRTPKERKIIGDKKGVIILTTSGMMQGGPVLSYMEKFIGKKENYIILSGYQANRTIGRQVYEDRVFYHKHKKYQVLSKVKKFDFSAHLGREEIIELVNKMKPKNLILNHGDVEAISSLNLHFKENNPKLKIFTPELNEEMKF